MDSFISFWAKTVIQLRVPILIMTFAALCFAPLSFNRLYHDDSNENYFLKDDANLKAFNRQLELFGDSEYLLVGVEARAADEDLFTAETITMIHKITEFLENHRQVSQVRSLSKYEYTHDADGIMATDDLFEDIGSLQDEPDALAQARQIMEGEELALESLITKDFKHTLISARTAYIRGSTDHKVEVVTDLRQFIKEQGFSDQEFNLHISGITAIGERFTTLTQRDMAWLNPVMAVVLTGILLAIFRSLFATLLPFVLIGSTLLLTIGLQGWLRWPFTAVNSALIPTVIILSMSTAIHIMVEFFRFRIKGEPPKLAAQSTIKDLFFPVCFTCVTTAAGFFTLSITKLTPVREFALLAAWAAMMIFLIGMTSLPALLSYIPWIAKGINQPTFKSGAIARLLTRLPTLTAKFKKPFASAGLLIGLFSLYSVSHLNVDSNIVNYFKENSWAAQDIHYFNNHFSGIANIEMIIDSGEDGGIKDPEFLQRVEALQNHLESLPDSGKAISLIRFYKQINQSLNHDNPDFFSLPTSRNMAAQFLLLYENTGPEEDFSDLKDFDERYMRVSIPFKNMDTVASEAELAKIKQHIAAEFSDLNLEISGSMVMNNALNTYIGTGMVKSFSIAILIIGLSFFILFRSIKYGVIALVPSIVPILLTGGIVSLAGIAMDLGTMIVGAMTIGIAVDDSIHLMSRYLLRKKQGFNTDEALRSALNTSGKAVILTSIILVSGFSVMLFGSFISYIYVGLFSAMIMSFALIGDLIFMPALIYLFDGSDTNSQSSTHTEKLEENIANV